jgi:hypothetical protein
MFIHTSENKKSSNLRSNVQSYIIPFETYFVREHMDILRDEAGVEYILESIYPLIDRLYFKFAGMDKLPIKPDGTWSGKRLSNDPALLKFLHNLIASGQLEKELINLVPALPQQQVIEDNDNYDYYNEYDDYDDGQYL